MTKYLAALLLLLIPTVAGAKPSAYAIIHSNGPVCRASIAYLNYRAGVQDNSNDPQEMLHMFGIKLKGIVIPTQENDYGTKK